MWRDGRRPLLLNKEIGVTTPKVKTRTVRCRCTNPSPLWSQSQYLFASQKAAMWVLTGDRAQTIVCARVCDALLRQAGLSSRWLSSAPYWRRFARNYGTTNARFYSSDFGSDLFIGDLVLSRESSSCEQAGTPTLPSRMISFWLSFLP